MKILRKITVRDVFGKIDLEVLLAKPEKKMELLKVYGIARKAIPGQSSMGDFVKFSGSFRATNSETGEIFQSGAMILPPVVQDLLAGALGGESVEDVQFGFSLGARYEADAVTKYVYEVESLIAPEENDPLERLGAQLGVKALAAPTPAADPEPAPTADIEPAKKK